MLIAAYTQQGRFKEALSVIDQWNRVTGRGPWAWAWETYVYGQSGNMVQARQTLNLLEKACRKRNFGLDPDPLLITAYAGIRDKEKLLALLQNTCRRRTNIPTTFKVESLYDLLRRDARFQELLHDTGFSLHRIQ
jgi:pentatricopeptide repeat protein